MKLVSKLKELCNRATSRSWLIDVALERHRLAQEGEAVLGRAGWGLLRRYGRMMSGTFSGQYVSGLPGAEVRALLRALQRGERIPVHLMHKHRSGCYESSSLSLVDGCLLMHYSDRTEPAE